MLSDCENVVIMNSDDYFDIKDEIKEGQKYENDMQTLHKLRIEIEDRISKQSPNGFFKSSKGVYGSRK